MASSPPFQLEDQTDEDFFDKLVDDDEFKVTAITGHSFADGNDSDELKAFANLSIGEVGVTSEDLGGEGGIEAKEEETSGDANAMSVDGHIEENSLLVSSNYGHVEESSSLVSSNSLGFDGVIESNGGAIVMEETSDSTVHKINESGGSGVKEVQWAAFNTDSVKVGSNGFGSYSDFFSELGDGVVDQTGKVVDNFSSESMVGSGSEGIKTGYDDDNNYNGQYQGNEPYDATMGQQADGQDLNSSQYWENLYPGWKYDPNTGQWYQVDGYDANGNIRSFDSNYSSDCVVSDGNSQVSYLQQTAQSFVGTVTKSGTTESVTDWYQLPRDRGMTECVTNLNKVSQESGSAEGVSTWSQVAQENGSVDGVSNWDKVLPGNNEYPAHMVFDPQYPGWYYDTIAQEWQSLETYTSSPQSTVQAHDQLSQIGLQSTATVSHNSDKKTYNDYGQAENYRSQGFDTQSQDHNRAGSFSNYNHQDFNMWQPETLTKTDNPIDFSGNQLLDNDYGSNSYVSNHLSQQMSYVSGGAVPFYEKATQVDTMVTTSGSQGFVPSGNFSQQVNQQTLQQKDQMHVSNGYYGNQNPVNSSQQQFQIGHQFSYAPNAGRSSAGRPPHALVTFGFGGKLIVLKDSSSLSTSSYGSQGPLGGSISVLNLMEVVTEKIDASSVGVGTFGYFNTLCRESFPSPLVGGNVGSKELNKWIDERVANCESSDMGYRKHDALSLLLSLLKIGCQHYGKFRSPFGSDNASRESDAPEPAVARLFASAKRNGAQFSDYSALAHCLQKLPPEAQLQATAAEVQSLLVSGRKKEALLRASEGQLWGPALILAAQLGNQFYADTVKQMALHQLVAGSPLRTLCLLIAGQPADVFSTDTTFGSSISGAVNLSLHPALCGSNGMLDNWEENLAVIIANRTKDDGPVLMHLGDSLWKDRSERTELYEYSKVLGNAQFILLPFQPYKLIYAHMLAEVGKLTEATKYCQAVLKYLKTGRAPEVNTWTKLASLLEERIRAHQQGGYSTNLAPAKLVGKFLNLVDSTAHRLVGGLPPPVPSASQSSAQANEHYYQPMGASQSTMAVSSLMPSTAMEPIGERAADGSRITMHNRSVSEPVIGRSPRQDQVDSSKEATSSSASKSSVLAGVSRFGRFSFGSQLLQKTVGLVLKPRQEKQAKLGEKNRFYYDEKLKRWVEEGAEPPAEEAAPPPPPTTAAFQNGMSDYNLNSALKSNGPYSNGSPDFKSPTPSDNSSGIPPIPPASNQFSARGRMGVRSRYVDTFNKGGGNPTSLFQSPSVSSIKPASGSNPKFFVPSPVSSSERTFDSPDTVQETTAITENPLIPNTNNLAPSPTPSPSMTMQRFPSMDTISDKNKMMNGNSSLSSYSRRTASWSGSFSDAYSPQQRTELKPLGEVLGISPSSFMPIEPSLSQLPVNGGSFGDDLHEVEL
ncbi:Protein transport protein like [Actinidia chinensis var. chinensis]|uniref:Protein transport protein sec16 n=1 Tax=Actinidia chinensis var. chinensis TaxID=1590841 RepID=A0A2R6QNN9_ACTCC|nr:Protein transport protein like [Actinidia chinensis var. chinensis]